MVVIVNVGNITMIRQHISLIRGDGIAEACERYKMTMDKEATVGYF